VNEIYILRSVWWLQVTKQESWACQFSDSDRLQTHNFCEINNILIAVRRDFSWNTLRRIYPRRTWGRTPRAVIPCTRVNITTYIQTTLVIQAFIIRGLAYMSKRRFCLRAMSFITVLFTAIIAQRHVGAGARSFHVASYFLYMLNLGSVRFPVYAFWIFTAIFRNITQWETFVRISL
jgi:hypothetical protein